MRLSYKDLLLLFGIVVAVIIALTSLVHRERPAPQKTTDTEAAPRTGLRAPGTLLRKTIGRVVYPILQTAATASSR